MRRAHDDHGGGRLQLEIIAGRPQRDHGGEPWPQGPLRHQCGGWPAGRRTPAEGGGGLAGATPRWGRAAGAQSTPQPGTERRNADASRRHSMTRTGHANHQHLPGELITVDVQLDENRGPRPGRHAAGRRACHSNQEAVPRGRPWESRAQSRSGRRVRDGTPRFREWKRWKATTPLSVGHGRPERHPTEGDAHAHPLVPNGTCHPKLVAHADHEYDRRVPRLRPYLATTMQVRSVSRRGVPGSPRGCQRRRRSLGRSCRLPRSL